MDIEGIKRPTSRQQRAQFRSSYYYSPSRPESPYATRSAPAPRPAPRPAPAQHAPTHQPAPIRHQAPAKKSSGVIPVLIMMTVMLGAAGVGAKLFVKRGSDKPVATQARTETKAAEQQPVVAEPISEPEVVLTTTEEMATAINGVINGNKPLNIGVSIVDLKSGESQNYGLDVPFDAASTGKVLSAAYLLNQVEAGKQNLSSPMGGHTIGDQLSTMIEKSDNNAWTLINTELGHKNLTNYARSVGASDYEAVKNTMSPKSLASVLAGIYQSKILNQANRDLLLGHMKNANKTDFILSALPGNITSYHKAGWLDDRSHDSAIIDNGKHPYVLVVYVKGRTSDDTAQRVAVIHKITNATVAHFISKDSATQLASATN